MQRATQTELNHVAFSELRYQPILGDGHCLFNAVGMHIGENGISLRNKVVDYFEENSFRYYWGGNKQTYLDHKAAIRAGQAWGDHLEIEAIQRFLDRPIIILRPDSNPTIPDNIANYQGEPIFIYYNGRDHYDALILNEGANRRYILYAIITAMHNGQSLAYTATPFSEHSPEMVQPSISPYRRSRLENIDLWANESIGVCSKLNQPIFTFDIDSAGRRRRYNLAEKIGTSIMGAIGKARYGNHYPIEEFKHVYCDLFKGNELPKTLIDCITMTNFLIAVLGVYTINSSTVLPIINFSLLCITLIIRTIDIYMKRKAFKDETKKSMEYMDIDKISCICSNDFTLLFGSLVGFLLGLTAITLLFKKGKSDGVNFLLIAAPAISNILTGINSRVLSAYEKRIKSYDNLVRRRLALMLGWEYGFIYEQQPRPPLRPEHYKQRKGGITLV